MDNFELFDKLYTLLKANSQYPFAKECIDSIEQRLVIFERGKLEAREIQIRDTKAHYEIQKDVTHSHVEGYEKLLTSLHNYIKPKIQEIVIITEEHSYIILCNEKASVLIGILRSHYSNLAKVISIHNENSTKGFRADRVKIFKTIFQKW